MAVDTRDKRASCLGINAPWRVVLPNPDAAAENQADRQQLAYCYPGILAGALVTVDGEDIPRSLSLSRAVARSLGLRRAVASSQSVGRSVARSLGAITPGSN